MDFRPALQHGFCSQASIRQSCERCTGPPVPVSVSDAALAKCVAVPVAALLQQAAGVDSAFGAFSGLRDPY